MDIERISKPPHTHMSKGPINQSHQRNSNTQQQISFVTDLLDSVLHSNI
jgi:hypothetical protein